MSCTHAYLKIYFAFWVGLFHTGAGQPLHQVQPGARAVEGKCEENRLQSFQ